MSHWCLAPPDFFNLPIRILIIKLLKYSGL
jgi:hypothetical protein